MKKHIIIIALAALSLPSLAQTTLKSGFYLPGMLNRHKINPAVINDSDGYIGIPALSDITIKGATNLGIGKLLFPMQGGGLTTFMNKSIEPSKFLSGLNQMNNLEADVSLDILSAGFRAGQSYNTIALGLESYTSAFLPYALFDFMKSGMTSPDVTHYSIKNLTARTTNYMHLSYGYARPIGSDWTVGAKIKFIVGLANVNARIDHMDIAMSQNEWLVRSHGTLDAAGPGNIRYTTGSDGAISGFSLNNINVAGYGAGIDLGATYQTPVEGLKVSLAVVDLGFISWNTNAMAKTDSKEFSFKGFQDISGGGSQNRPIDEQVNDLKNQVMALFKFYPEVGSSRITTSLRTTLNVGVEYDLVPDIFSFGLLSSTRFTDVFTLSELILSANYRPCSWFNMAVTGDFSNVATSFGAIINLCPKFINFYAGVDFMLTEITPQFIPMRSGSPMVSIGLNVPIYKCHKYYKSRR